MITVEPTTDEAYIKSVLMNPTIYAGMCDDSCPSVADFDFSKLMAIPGFFLCAMVDGVRSGLWWLVWRGDAVEAHTALLENCRGRRAIVATKAAIKWVFEHTEANAITSFSWSDCPAISWFCKAVGMTAKETHSWHAKRSGQPVDITYFSINRGTPCQQ